MTWIKGWNFQGDTVKYMLQRDTSIPKECIQKGCVFIQVGVHGAGLVNAYFLRPGSALVEIFPCRFSHPSLLFWPSQYFWHPSRQERQSYAFQIHMKYETRCKPSQLERNPAGAA